MKYTLNILTSHQKRGYRFSGQCNELVRELTFPLKVSQKVGREISP